MRIDFRKLLAVGVLAAICAMPSHSQADTYDQEDFQGATQAFEQKMKEQADEKMKDAFKQIKCYEKRMNADAARKKQKEAGQKGTPFTQDTWPDFESAKGMTDKLGSDLFDKCE